MQKERKEKNEKRGKVNNLRKRMKKNTHQKKERKKQRNGRKNEWIRYLKLENRKLTKKKVKAKDKKERICDRMNK